MSVSFFFLPIQSANLSRHQLFQQFIWKCAAMGDAYHNPSPLFGLCEND